MSVALYIGRVTHARFKPARHKLSYRVFMGLFDIDRLAETARQVRLFGYNRPNLIAFYDRDHGDRSPRPLRAQIQEVLARAGLAAQGQILLLCMPRVLGHVFNPLSVYFCHDRAGALTAIVHEVNNTYGERHFYALPADVLSNGRIQQSCEKTFRVSPLLPMDLRYDFSILAPSSETEVSITVSDARGPLLAAAFSGSRRAFNASSIFRAWLTHPALTWKVVAGIHWEALATFVKLGWAKLALRRARRVEP